MIDRSAKNLISRRRNRAERTYQSLPISRHRSIYVYVSHDLDRKAALLASLDEDAYADVPVPTRADIRAALKRGAAELRDAAEQPKAPKVDPKIRFR